MVEHNGEDDPSTGCAGDGDTGRERAPGAEMVRDDAERRDEEKADSEPNPNAL